MIEIILLSAAEGLGFPLSLVSLLLGKFRLLSETGVLECVFYLLFVDKIYPFHLYNLYSYFSLSLYNMFVANCCNIS